MCGVCVCVCVCSRGVSDEQDLPVRAVRWTSTPARLAMTDGAAKGHGGEALTQCSLSLSTHTEATYKLISHHLLSQYNYLFWKKLSKFHRALLTLTESVQSEDVHAEPHRSSLDRQSSSNLNFEAQKISMSSCFLHSHTYE